MHHLRISQATQASLRCPICRANLNVTDAQFVCADPACGARFPIIDGIPILLDDRTSIFSIAEIVAQRDASGAAPANTLKSRLRRLIPSINKNVRAQQNYEKLAGLLHELAPAPKILVVGGGVVGQGMEALTHNPAVELIETDVSLGPRTALVCDAHDIPFESETFDGVIVQAVLEHVVDPYRCVDEIHRILKPQGLVYAETPFMQQVHMAPYDFTRFTHLGHRRLFRKFDEIDSGAVCGPGMALAWSYQYFLYSFTKSRTRRGLAMAFARFTSFYLKYFDPFLIDRPGALDAASGYYFMGRKAGHVLSDRELVKLYRGTAA